METEEIRWLITLPGLSEDFPAVELLGVEEQQVLIATTSLHCQQNYSSVVPTHEMIRELEIQRDSKMTHGVLELWPVTPQLRKK